MAAREGAVTAKRAGLCQLRDLLVTTPEPLRAELRSLTRARLLARLTATRPQRRQDTELRGTLHALRSVARRVQQLIAEERELAREIETLTRTLAPQLLDQPGVGLLLAAQVVLSWSHHGRVVSEAAFARLAGVAPIPASSGQTIRYRLDRGGDRRLNRALHQILITRRRTHPPTISYIERRIQEGKNRREAIRCLKRYLARKPLPAPRERTAAADLTDIEASLTHSGVVSSPGLEPLGELVELEEEGTQLAEPLWAELLRPLTFHLADRFAHHARGCFAARCEGDSFRAHVVWVRASLDVAEAFEFPEQVVQGLFAHP